MYIYIYIIYIIYIYVYIDINNWVHRFLILLYSGQFWHISMVSAILVFHFDVYKSRTSMSESFNTLNDLCHVE